MWFLRDGLPEVVAGLVAIGIGAIIILVVGIFDDVRSLSPQHKLAWQVAAATAAGLALAMLGVRLSLFLEWPSPPIILLTVFWVVAITNSVNFLDNMNGLCAGIGALAALALAAVNIRSAPTPPRRSRRRWPGPASDSSRTIGRGRASFSATPDRC
jgi:UDP-GlcNAc:undecaprenyl-phosphate GlcNAc-1-phosphate transferase